ncbi:AAA family ATPase [Dolichospermum circinale CS-534/05]|uniref:AAA family ATPase n=1 Tax=Dolichospermum circinale TaxID=109265 RepID=UPI00232E0131|nr:AAA family ATPase [Dolichospermum circinale]MDB9454401.1 AAA family ATPase [Dolichospermum circinale CS-541/06]MDB9462436.1 AAA family ATPase [Dolichospermum circinale CS-541/04]MDB9491828.1 AAA family ATPase [Dolichospermum circinale CS-534/05]MDB9546867.1 AAA family ATPase [Dolichospermum circinale CS-1031]
MEHTPDTSFQNSMWIIALLPDKLPGYVSDKKAGGQLIIDPLVAGLPLSDGTVVKRFFAHNGNANINDYVTFSWRNPGQRMYNKIQQKDRDPLAVNVQVIREDEALQIVDDIRKTFAIELQIQLEQQQNELQQQIEKVTQQAEETAQQRTQFLRDELNRKEQDLLQQKILLDEERQHLDQQQKHIELRVAKAEKAERLWVALEPYRAAIPLVIEDENSIPSEKCPLPENLGQQWNQMLNSSGLTLPNYVGVSYLLSLFSALYTGSLVVLNGSVGVGKTSVIRQSANLIGGKSTIVPVRPAWLDSADLLGFFDPLSETFRPSPFLTALKDAKKQPDRLHLVCLDELNLAKIENYGADLLSALEYSRSHQVKQNLLLYSESIETELIEEAKLIHEEEQRDSKQTQRLRRIQNILKDYPSNFSIPKNLVLLGTLNSDETTYDLSPKVIDRSFVITYPLADLTLETIPEQLNYQSISKDISVSNLRDEINLRTSGQIEGWETIVKWNKQYLFQLGIPLGHRAKRDYSVFNAAAHLLGLTDKECLGYFIATKLLPRISFFKDSAYNQDNRDNLCRNWLQELDTYRDFGLTEIIKELLNQLDDERRRNVRYWG